jgi:hypothetical protein
MKINFDFPPSVPEVKKRLQKYSKEVRKRFSMVPFGKLQWLF